MAAVWHRRWGRDWKREKEDLLTTGSGREYAAEAQTKADAWVFSLSNWCHLMSWGKQGRALLGVP